MMILTFSCALTLDSVNNFRVSRESFFPLSTETSWLTVIMGILFLTLFLIITIIYYLKLQRKVALVKEALRYIERYDPFWRKEYLYSTVKKAFFEVLKAWSNIDKAALRSRLTPELYSRWEKRMNRMEEVRQREVIWDIELKRIMFIDIQDYTDDSLDRFTARIRYRAVRYTVNYEGEWMKPAWEENIDPNPGMEQKEYIEFWTFARSESDWKVAAVEQEWKEGDYLNSEPVLLDKKYDREEV